MELYHLLPIVAVFSNIALGLYIFHNNPKERLNRLYAMITLSVAIWCGSDLMFFLSKTPEEAIRWNKIGTLGTSLVVSFLLHFFIVFTKKNIKPIFYFPLYVIPFLFFLIDILTPLISMFAYPAPWGYSIQAGPLYPLYTIFIVVGYILFGFILCIRYYRTNISSKERSQAKLLIVGMSIPLITGIALDIIPSMTGYYIFPISSTLTTTTDICMAIAIVRYGLMTITPEAAAGNIIETINDYLVVLNQDKKIIVINKPCLNAVSCKKEDMIGKDMSELVMKSNDLYTAFIDSSIKHFETEIKTCDGDVFPVSINGSIMRTKKGATVGYVFLIRDMREVKELVINLKTKTEELERAKDTLQNVNVDLEQKIKERTAELEKLKNSLEEQVKERTAQLNEKLGELERMNTLMVGREVKMAELKAQIETLKPRNSEKIPNS